MNEAILIIYMVWGGGMPTIEHEHPFPTMEECLTILEKTKLHTPVTSAENDWIAVATCRMGKQ